MHFLQLISHAYAQPIPLDPYYFPILKITSDL